MGEELTFEEMQKQLNELEQKFKAFDQLVDRELEHRDVRELGMLRRLYEYMAPELDGLRAKIKE